MPSATAVPAAGKKIHPALYMVLIAPFGATSGYIGVSVAYLLTQAQVGATEVAGLLALTYVPQAWKFLWAPLVDLTLGRERWYLIGLAGTVLGMVLVGESPMHEQAMARITGWALVMGTAATLLAMAVEGLMAHRTEDDAKGKAAGWFQAGNLGGSGLGGGAALWLVQSGGLAGPAAAAILAALCALCALPLFFIGPDGEHASAAPGADIGQRLRDIARDLWSVLRAPRGALAVLIVFLPLGTGAMSNMYSIMAAEWHATANTVALVTGTMSGLLSVAGCLIGGQLCDRMNRQFAYLLFGIVLALASVVMALAPRTEWNFVVWTSLYSLLNGLCYAAFSAVALEAIGKGAAATKYNLMASLSNTPIGWSTALYGWVFSQAGSRITLLTELGLTLAAAALFLLARRWSEARTLAA